MTGTRPAEILRQLEQSVEPDGELLARFAASRDAQAFAELVRRYGSLVLGVCRRVTGHAQDAEDAFQATFLVLAKRAASLRTSALVGNWLYGVACRVALRARRSAARRRTREVVVSVLPDSPAESPLPAMPELSAILDEELAALPAHYRDAIVLCDLRGVSREQAAIALGIPEGTLSSRLTNGRKKLAARLTRRGVTLSVAALPAAITEATVSASVPNELITKTCGLVANWAADGGVPGPLARLAEGGFAVRKTLLIVAVMTVAVAGAVFAAHSNEDAPRDPPQPPTGVQKPELVAQPKVEPKPAEQPEKFTMTPRMQSMFDVSLTPVGDVRWNPAGTHIAVSGWETKQQRTVNGGIAISLPTVLLLGTDAKSKRMVAFPSEGARLVAALPDGKGIVTDLREYQLISGHHQLDFWVEQVLPPDVMKPLTPRMVVGRTVNLDLPETHGYVIAADMKTFRTVAWHRDAVGNLVKLEVLKVDLKTGKAEKSLLKTDYGEYAFSDNGKRLAVLAKDMLRVTVYDVDRGEKLVEHKFPDEKAAGRPELSGPPNLILSPDGQRLAVTRGLSRTSVLKTDTGEALPALEGANEQWISPDIGAFTSDGRLFAAVGTRYDQVVVSSPGGGRQTSWQATGSFLTVWDTQTGKALKTWSRGKQQGMPRVAFNPTKPLLAILEPNSEQGFRIGFWDFAAEVEKK